MADGALYFVLPVESLRHLGVGGRTEGERVETYGSEDRALFETLGTALYEEIVEAGGLPDTDDRIQPGGELHQAFQLLVELRLDPAGPRQQTSGSPRTPTASRPASCPPSASEAAQLLDESSQLGQAPSGR